LREASLLVYCVCETPLEPQPGEIRGVDGQPVYLIDDEGLCAVVSDLRHPAGALAADVSRILDFEKVVEAFHRARTVLPFRFGCVLDGEMRVKEALRARRGEYQAFLGRLNGCVEMGVRLLPPWKDRAPSGDGPGPDSAADGAAPMPDPDAVYNQAARSAAHAAKSTLLASHTRKHDLRLNTLSTRPISDSPVAKACMGSIRGSASLRRRSMTSEHTPYETDQEPQSPCLP